MVLINEIQKIIDFESNFPRSFADVEKKGYTENPTSYDSNHAVILTGKDLNYIVGDIEKFYSEKKLIPRIYSSLKDGKLSTLKPYLIKHGFTISTEDKHTYLVHKYKNRIDVPSNLAFKRVFRLNNSIIRMLESQNVERITILMKRHLKKDKFHLLIGCLDDETPVTMASIEYNDDGIARIDNVLTSINYRGRGYARQITQYFVDYHYQHTNNIMYLNSENPTAIRIYKKAGFVPFEHQFETWTAWKK
jgi:ribosomal protein S18 acetylase RimI-like enzyme